MRKHKHAGIVQWKKGIKSLKLHPVSSKHRDIYDVRCHNMETGRYKRTQNFKKIINLNRIFKTRTLQE